MSAQRVLLALGLAALLHPALADTADAACRQLRTARDVSNIRQNLDGEYCLANDINLVGIANFQPIGSLLDPFSGTLDGRGHVIRNLKINSAGSEVGLFAAISFAEISRLGLVNTDVNGTATARVGGLAGDSYDSDVRLVYVTGSVRSRSSPCLNCYVGALFGIENNGTTSQVYSTARVSGREGSTVGGLFGTTSGRTSFAFVQGPIFGPDFGSIGGLAGELSGTLQQTYSAAEITAEGAVGGLVAFANGPFEIRASYWDTQTTKTQRSDGGGVGLTTRQLKSRFPAGFSQQIWARTRNTYPWLRNLPKPAPPPRPAAR